MGYRDLQKNLVSLFAGSAILATSAFAAEPTFTSAVLSNNTMDPMKVDLTVTGTDFDTFVSSGTTDADGSDLLKVVISGIEGANVSPIEANVTSATTLSLTFNAEDLGTEVITGSSLDFMAGLVQDSSLAANLEGNVTDSSITDSASPLLIAAGAVDDTTIALEFSEDISLGGLSASDFNVTGFTVSNVAVDSGKNNVVLLTVDSLTGTIFPINELNVSAGLSDSAANLTMPFIGYSVEDFMSGGPEVLSATLTNNTDPTQVDVTITGANLSTFVNSGTTTADATDLTNITFVGVDDFPVNPISAVTNGTDTMTLTFYAEDAKTGVIPNSSIDFAAGTFQDDSNVANQSVQITDGNITDNAIPVFLEAAADSDTSIFIDFSEPLNSLGSLLPSSFTATGINVTDAVIDSVETDVILLTVEDLTGVVFPINDLVIPQGILDTNSLASVDYAGLTINDERNTNPTGSEPELMIAEFDNDGDAKYSYGDTIYMQFPMQIALADLSINEFSADNNQSIGSDANLTDADSSFDISTFPNFSAVVNDGNSSNTFILTLGSDTNVSTGDHIIIDTSNISYIDDQDIDFPLLAVADADAINSELTEIRTKLADDTTMPADIRTEIEGLLSQIDALLVDGITDNNEQEIISLIGQIHSLADNIGNEDYYLHGADASKLSGTVTLPSGFTPTAEESCFDSSTHTPLPECNAIFIDLMSKDNSEWYGSTMVQSDGSYELYYRELTTNETIEAVVQLHIQQDGTHESYYYDFGDDNASGGSSTAADTFKSHTEVQWVEDTSTNMWYPQVNHLNISTQETTLDLDMSNMDAGYYVLEGTITVEAGFEPGEILGSNGEWLGFQMVNLTAINIATGEQYWTEIGRTESSTNAYPFKFKLPDTDADYIIKIEKFSDKDGFHEFNEMYVDDGDDDRAFDGDESLVASNSVMWNETSQDSGIWVPDTSKTGYFNVTANVNSIAIDLTTFGSNFYKIAGAVTPPSDFDMSDYSYKMNIDAIDATTGMWLGGSPVMCDNTGANCTYSIILGDSLNDYDGSGNGGYILRVNQEHWDETDWENSWWKGFYYDFGGDNSINGDSDSIISEFDVPWSENINDTTGEFYHVPDVNHLHISSATAAADVPDVNISFASYVAPTTYTITGTISGIPANAKWANINIFNPSNYTGTGAEVESDGSFEIENLKEGDYILELHYDVEDSGMYRHYHYIITDDDGDFSTGTSAVDGMEVEWKPYDNNGNSLEADTYDVNFDWSTVSFWAPEVSGRVVKLTVDSDISMSTLTISPTTLLDLLTTMSGLEANANINFDLFVPNKPIGRWENTTADGSGDANATFTELKERDDYHLRVWVDGLGEFWYNDSTGTLDSDVYWVGKQNDVICDDWKNETWTCDWSQPVEWGPNIAGFTIDATLAGTGLNLTLPNDRAKITAIIDLPDEYDSNQTHVNIWQHNGNNYAWDEYEVNSTGDILVSMSVKKGDNYRMEIWIPETWEGFVVEGGSDGVINTGSDDGLVTNQNSWDNTPGSWGPKASTLISADDANLTSDVLDLGTLTPPTLSTLTVTVNNLDTNGSGDVIEHIFVDLEATDGSGWYGMDNADWTDWENPTYANTISLKVPNGDYRVMVHPQNHKGGVITNNNGSTDDDLLGAGASAFTWDWDEADMITISGNSAFTVNLPAAADLKSMSGTVSGITDGNMTGWIHAWSPTAEGNGVEVAGDGSFEIKGLTPADDYTIEFWSWLQPEHIKVSLGVWDDNDTTPGNDVNESIAGLAVAKPSVVHTFSGTLTNNTGSNENMSVLLIEVDDNDSNGIDAGDPWEVIDDSDAGDLADSGTHNFTFNVPPALSGYEYAIAVGVKTVDSTTGATTYAAFEARDDENASVTIDNIDTNASISVSFTESVN